MSREEAEELTRKSQLRADALKKKQKEEWLASAGGQLCMKFWNAFREYQRLSAGESASPAHGDGLVTTNITTSTSCSKKA